MNNADMNKIDRVGQIEEGCRTGVHLWDEKEGHSTVETDGDLTKVKLRCLLCGRQYDISVPLGLNAFINKQPQQSQPPQKTEIQNNTDEGQSDILKRLLE